MVTLSAAYLRRTASRAWRSIIGLVHLSSAVASRSNRAVTRFRLTLLEARPHEHTSKIRELAPSMASSEHRHRVENLALLRSPLNQSEIARCLSFRNRYTRNSYPFPIRPAPPPNCGDKGWRVLWTHRKILLLRVRALMIKRGSGARTRGVKAGQTTPGGEDSPTSRCTLTDRR